MAFGGGANSGFIKLAPLARSASPRYGVLRGMGGINTSISKPRGVKPSRPGAAVKDVPNMASPFGKGPTLGKIKR